MENGGRKSESERELGGHAGCPDAVGPSKNRDIYLFKGRRRGTGGEGKRISVSASNTPIYYESI